MLPRGDGAGHNSMDIRALLTACLAAALLGGCDAQGTDAAAANPPGEHSIDPATGERRITIHREDGPVTLREGAGVPVRLPAGFNLFSGARVVSNAIAARPGGEGVLVTFETDAPASEAIAHTRREAEAAGFSVEVDLDTGETRTIAGTRASDRATFSLTVTQGTPTTAQLSARTMSQR
jgi:hypothetical protein